MKQYKYSREEWLEYYENNVHIHITQEAKEDLLAKESNEEYSQKIMMEQVPKKFSKKDYNKLNKALDNMAGHEPTGIFANKPVKGVLKEKHSTGKQEDNKECTCEQYYIPDSCPIHGINRKTNPLIEKCPNCTEQDENIKPMPDGSCGVCGGKGYIEWKKVGKINPTPSPQEEHKWLYELKDWKDFTLDELEFEIVSIIRHWKKEQK